MGWLGAPESSILKLVNSQELQTLLYGTIALSLTKSKLQCLDFGIIAFLLNCLKLSLLILLDNVNFIVIACLPFSYIYKFHRYNFLKKLIICQVMTPRIKIDVRL